MTRPTTPAQDATEWPVDDEDLDAICDAALDEPAYEAVERFVRGGCCPDGGFAETLRQSRERTARLAAEVPSVRNVLGARRRKAFLRALSQAGNVAVACAAAGWSRGIPYSLRRADADFAEKWDFALENATDVLHGAAFQRAVHGVQEDVWHKPKDGDPQVIGHVARYSDQLLMFLLKAHDRKRFGDRAEVGIESKGGVLVVPGVTADPDAWEAAASANQARYREREDPE